MIKMHLCKKTAQQKSNFAFEIQRECLCEIKIEKLKNYYYAYIK